MSYGNKSRTGNRLCLGKSLVVERLGHKAAVIDQFAALSSIEGHFYCKGQDRKIHQSAIHHMLKKIGKQLTTPIFWRSLKTVLEACPLVNVYRLSYPTISTPPKN